MPESIFPDVISAKDLQERISALNQEAKSIDFYDLEEDAQDAALEGLQAQTQSLLRRAFGVLDGVIARYATYHRTFHAAADQSQTSVNTCYDAEQCEKANNLVELTKIAKNILRGKGELATGAAAGQEDRFHRLILVSDLLREIIKSCMTADKVICDIENLSSRIDFQSELERASQVRRIFADFLHRLDETETTLSFIRSKLLRTGNIIASVIGRPCFRHFRPEDRLLFRRLQSRIRDWLARVPNTPESGDRLWEDITFSSQLLLEINNRDILIDHDLKIINQLLGHFARCPKVQTLSEEMSCLCRELLGRDRNLDKMLLQSQPIRTKPLVALLEEILGSIGSMGGSF